ncbi:LysM peptidoglycan-binding domain-containing protein [Candidatus Saccharibacteria bacterium]|nr:LysM peptidoglycan-binding domain-containing protein [Candidatus Saccharibacteria bacterium]
MTIAAAYGLKWKHLAKVNRIKAPYLLKAGSVLLVPSEQVSRKKRKGRKNDWTVNNEHEEQNHVSNPQVAEPYDTGRQNNARPTGLTQTPSAVEFESPREAPNRPVRPAPQQSWQSPLSSDEDMDIEGPDWREGASDDELRAIGVLHDSSAVPTIQNTWELDTESEKPPRKAKRQKSSKQSAKNRRTKSKKEKE